MFINDSASALYKRRRDWLTSEESNDGYTEYTSYTHRNFPKKQGYTARRGVYSQEMNEAMEKYDLCKREMKMNNTNVVQTRWKMNRFRRGLREHRSSSALSSSKIRNSVLHNNEQKHNILVRRSYFVYVVENFHFFQNFFIIRKIRYIVYYRKIFRGHHWRRDI